MKTFFVALLFFGFPLFAGSPYNVELNTASLTTSYVSAALSSVVSASHFRMQNEGTAGVCCETEALSLPSAGNGHELCIPANFAQSWDGQTINGTVWCRRRASSTGTLTVEAW